MAERSRVTSGVRHLDRLLGGLCIGDNVVWYDDAGSLAAPYCHNFMHASLTEAKPLIYISFDRSPRNLLEKLGPLADNERLTILDCFTHGKGAGSSVFLSFYDEATPAWPCRILLVEDPRRIDHFVETFYRIHGSFSGDVHFVFESITGMQEIWGGEEQILNFYSHSCPRLYELNTIAYWVMEKKAHSPRLRAQINQIAQVVIDLAIKRGTTSLTIVKAERRDLDHLHKPHTYWIRDQEVTFEEESHPGRPLDLGSRLRALRTRRGLSQTELARLIGVTPSTISQIESNLIYPSFPALLKMGEVLGVEIHSFFQPRAEQEGRIVFSLADAVELKLAQFPAAHLSARLLTPVDFERKAEPYLIEIPPGEQLPAHFFVHKGEEVGYLMAGTLQLKTQQGSHQLHAGDLVYLTHDTPSQWSNPGTEVARLIWLKIK
jgi:transcriptional regulator with XRE-family HTH domain